MNDFFATLILGHLIGDYVFQNKWMSDSKHRCSFNCAVHCLIYTAAVTVTTWSSIHGWQWSLLIFASHYPVDRWGLADKWLDLINGRSIKDFMKHGNQDILEIEEHRRENYRILRGGFTGLVYAVTDNTIHLMIMYYGAQLLWMMQ